MASKYTTESDSAFEATVEYKSFTKAGTCLSVYGQPPLGLQPSG